MNTVVSWDKEHMKNGYNGRFFGVFMEDAAVLKPGDQLEVLGLKSGPKVFTFSHLTGKPHNVEGRREARRIRYLHVEQPSLGCFVMDGMRWRKVVVTAEAGFHPRR